MTKPVFLYNQCVTSISRRFLAGVLLVLLPLQATAVAAICPHAKSAGAASAPVAAQTMDHCLHDQMSAVGDQSFGTPAGEPQQDDQKSSCCAAVSACAMCAIAVSLPQASVIESTPQKSDFFLSLRFTSFIPEGLQRPPSILA